MSGKKTVLIILDGWGHGDKNKSDAINNASTPFVDSLYKNYPNCELKTFGEHVGLPDSQVGNSEVGHLNIGAGRIIHQDLVKINLACEDNSIAEMPALKASFAYAKNNNKALHLIGLVSDGGIHSHNKHLYKLCELAHKEGIKNVFIHAFTDGRDCDPKSGKGFIKELQKNLFSSKIASVCGRYFAMDRDNRWERIKFAYDALTNGIGISSQNIEESIQNSYNNGITDEFIKPIIVVDKNHIPIGNIDENDSVICFNFRTDRCREITIALTQKNIFDFGMKRFNLHYTTLTNYDSSFNNVNVIYNKVNIKKTLGEVLEQNNKLQIRIAETEKYPHVTFFFSGGREKRFKNEKRLMINSLKVSTYDLKPEMSAANVTTTIIKELDKANADFICLNFANADMVGHTGDYNAIKKSVETVDNCTKKVVEAGLKNDYAFVIISDHGNADFAINKDGTPNTAHTKNLVPCFVINTRYNNVKNGRLADIAPTILKIMEVKIPEEMTGEVLIK
jgi:2,3-bisphosphoglycerate-independent phosphoglycerate mutase